MKTAAFFVMMAGSAAALSTPAPATVDQAAIRKAIAKIDKDNFSDTLSMVEPFLKNEAGITFYEKSIRRINRSAKEIGVEVPTDFAKEAKATAKRRAKQDAFIQAKVAAAAEAAEAAAAEAADAAEAAEAAAAEAAEAAEESTEESTEEPAAE